MATLLASLAQLGFQFVRLRRNSKQPASNGWKTRNESLRRIERWQGNLGILCGTQLKDGRRLLVIDIDAKNGRDGNQSLAKLEAKYGSLPPTADALTASGTKHLYFAVPADTNLRGIINLLSDEFPGIELLGQGRYAVAAPSVINGRSYDWEIFPTEGIANAPKWLLDLLACPKPTRPIREQTKAHREFTEAQLDDLFHSILRKYPVDGPGQRNQQMERAVGSLFGRGLQPTEIRKLMWSWHSNFRGRYKTGFRECIRQLDLCIEATAKQIDQQEFQVARDHDADRSQQDITADEQQRLDQLCEGYSQREKSFVAALFLQAKHELSLLVGCPCSPPCPQQYEIPPLQKFIKATNDQLQEILRQRFGIELNNEKLARLKKKYISREIQKATKAELLVIVEVGVRGRPSVYEIAGLSQALECIDGDEEVQCGEQAGAVCSVPRIVHWQECLPEDLPSVPVAGIVPAGRARRREVVVVNDFQSRTSEPAGDVRSLPCGTPQPSGEAGKVGAELGSARAIAANGRRAGIYPSDLHKAAKNQAYTRASASSARTRQPGSRDQPGRVHGPDG